MCALRRLASRRETKWATKWATKWSTEWATKWATKWSTKWALWTFCIKHCEVSDLVSAKQHTLCVKVHK